MRLFFFAFLRILKRRSHVNVTWHVKRGGICLALVQFFRHWRVAIELRIRERGTRALKIKRMYYVASADRYQSANTTRVCVWWRDRDFHCVRALTSARRRSIYTLCTWKNNNALFKNHFLYACQLCVSLRTRAWIVSRTDKIKLYTLRLFITFVSFTRKKIVSLKQQERNIAKSNLVLLTECFANMKFLFIDNNFCW